MPAKPSGVLVIGARALAQATTDCCNRSDIPCHIYLTGSTGSYGARSLGASAYHSEKFPNPCSIVKAHGIDLVIPMSIDWHRQPWANELVEMDTRVFSPHGDAVLLERNRGFSMKLAREHGIAVPNWVVVKTKSQALEQLADFDCPMVIKNPLCGTSAPIQTIVSHTLEETTQAINRSDDSQGIFMQELIGRREIGHIALVANGEVIPLVTNQEYKWSLDGNQGKVIGYPMGGIVEADPHDQYGLVRELIRPLEPWLKARRFCGPIQVTAGKWKNRWQVMEYNVRIGVTTGPLMMGMLENPIEVFYAAAQGVKPTPQFRAGYDFGMILGVAATKELIGKSPPATIKNSKRVLWGNVEGELNSPKLSGERPFELVAFGETVEGCRDEIYETANLLPTEGFRFRTDIGTSLWPPGNE